MNSLLEYAQALLTRAGDDAYVVRHLQERRDAPGWVVGFHAQQAVEKALKAVLSGAGQAYPRTHNLVMLTELLRTAGLPLPPDAEELGTLTPFGVVLRYEDLAADPVPAIDPAWLEEIVDRTLVWARQQLDKD